MIGDQILTFRKAKGMTQEELAVKLHIVRQTVSKWEKGLSVPDAQMLIQLSKCLDVTVAQLLDVPPQTSDQLDLAKELEKANEALAQLQQRDAQIRRAGRVRNLILYVSFLALAAALIVRHEVISILLIGGFIVTAGVILYRNLALLTSLTTQDFRLEPLRAATIFNLILFLLVISIALLAAVNLLPPSERWEKMLAAAIISCVMGFAGIISPKLPHNRHTGLRLPWTVQDADTWYLAHRILGVISIPLVVLYLAGAVTIRNFEAVTVTILLLWIGTPSIISLVFYWRKFHGRL